MIKKLFLVGFQVILFANFCLAQYSKIFDFDGLSNGSGPESSLISDGTYLYGMTSSGGTNNMGTIFKVLQDGSGFQKLLDFSGNSNGSYPFGALLLDGSNLYGMTRLGGIYDKGTLFKISTSGSNYLKLFDFDGSTSGFGPEGALTLQGGFLYGMTKGGGINDLGTIFRISSNGTGFLKLHDFTNSSSSSNGSNPSGSLISDGTYLYGFTTGGGINLNGTVFRINFDGTNFTKLFDFSGASTGAYPYGSLIFDGNFLYGTTREGGNSDLGTVFKIKTDGTGFQKMFNFYSYSNGYAPESSLIYDGSFLYGTTSGGGASSGTIFKIKTDGTGYQKIFDFGNSVNESRPSGSLILENGCLFGMTYYGGVNGSGVIYKFAVTSGEDEKVNNLDLVVFPNPTKDNINIFGNFIDDTIYIHNILGEEIFQHKLILLNDYYQVDLKEQPSGIYFISLNSQTIRIIKE